MGVLGYVLLEPFRRDKGQSHLLRGKLNLSDDQILKRSTEEIQFDGQIHSGGAGHRICGGIVVGAEPGIVDGNAIPALGDYIAVGFCQQMGIGLRRQG